MPNWVYNNITVEGKPEDIKSFMAKATKPYTTNYTPWNEEEPSEQLRDEFSFWNFVAPDQEYLNEYFETNGSKPDGNGGFIKTGDSPLNWYNWNIANWGTKWDAGDIQIDEEPGGSKTTISFSTAWDKPEPVFFAMVDQHPELQFTFRWMEEQGWGGEAVGIDGQFQTKREWDIPNSHEEYVALEEEEQCNCHASDDPDYWYDDCPKALEESN